MLSDPLARAIRSNPLAFREPIWSEGRPALVLLGEKLFGALTTAIRKGALSFVETLDWSQGSLAIESVLAETLVSLVGISINLVLV